MLEKLNHWREQKRLISENITKNSTIYKIEEEFNYHRNISKSLQNDYLINKLEKLEILQKLADIKSSNIVRISQNYDLDSDYEDMKYEYGYHINIRNKCNFKKYTNSIILNMA